MEKLEKVCPNCGHKINENESFCSACGMELSVDDKKEEKHPTKKETIDEAKLKEQIKVEILADLKRSELQEEKEELAEDIDVASVKSKMVIYPIISCLLTLLLCLIAFGFFYNYYMKNLVIETTRTEREVTVNDKGISDAVEKIYDATVVVESYSRGNLYATGSGFVYETDDNYGYILTNDHVIAGATEVKVLFSNEKRVTVKVLGSDSYSDVALLRVDKGDVVAVAELGSTEELKVGDTAFAVGAPLDSKAYAWTVTRGIISGKNRAVEVGATSRRASSVMEVLQTDAAINSGNSGGPLCNSNGQVIGITNMKLASSQIEGMGFAIPIEKAVENAEKLKEGGEVAYPYLGVYLMDSTNEEGGVLVDTIEKGSPADKAGLKKGDIIVKIDGTSVNTASRLKYILYKHDVGEKVTFDVIRDGKEMKITVTLGSSADRA